MPRSAAGACPGEGTGAGGGDAAPRWADARRAAAEGIPPRAGGVSRTRTGLACPQNSKNTIQTTEKVTRYPT